MKKFNHIVASLLASSVLLVGCANDAPCAHKDEDKNHLCDLCGEKVSECVDENNDHLCDVCSKELSTCIDEDHNHVCDICHETISEHKDEDKNHICDVCGEKVSECADENNDHLCDVCSKELSTCIDEDHDHICDICLEGLPYVASVTIGDAPSTICFGETITLTATVDARNGAADTVTWFTEDTCVSLSANGSSVTVTGVESGTATITAKATADETVLDSVTIEVVDWTSEDLALMESLLGERIPYIDAGYGLWDGSDFARYGLVNTSTQENALDATLAVLNSLENWEGEYDDAQEMYIYTKICDTDPEHYLEIWAYSVGGTTYLQIFVNVVPLTEWPEDKINSFFEDITDERPLVCAGDLYTFDIVPENTETGSPAYVSIKIEGGDALGYASALRTAGWIVDDSYYSAYMSYYGYGFIDCYSPNYSLEIQIADYVSEVYLAIVPTGLELPQQTAWTVEEQEMMTYYLGEVLPFANCGFTWEDYWDTEDNALEATSPFPGIADTMAAVFTEEDGWTTKLDSYGDYVFTKTSGDSVITVNLIDYFSYYGVFLMTATKKAIATDWTDTEKSLMEFYFGEVLPFFPGDFEWEENYYGTGLETYQSASSIDLDAIYSSFTSAGWTRNDVSVSKVEFTKLATNMEGYSISVVVTYDSWYDEYSISATLVKNPLTAWPAEELATILGDLTKETLPAYPTGEGITYSIEASTISPNKANLIVTGGNLATYKEILTLAGYSVEAESAGYGEFLSPEKTIYVYAEESGGILYLTVKAQEAPAQEGFNWATFASSFVVKVKDPNMGGKVSYRFTFDGSGGVTGVDSSTPSAISFTVTMDFVGCGDNQVHLTGSDADWNCIDVDIIVETTDGQTFTVVTDNSTSNFSF